MERELVERARRGDREAFEMLVRRRIDSMVRTARAILGHEADAQDAVQEAFVAAWRRLPGLRDPDRFDAWLGRILLNACRMSLRRRRGVREIRMVDAGDEQAGPADLRATALDQATADADAFDRAFARLPIEERALLVLRHRDELPVAEIAARLGIPAGTAKSRLFHARRALGRALAREDRP